MPMNPRKKLIFQNHLVQSSGISELTQAILCALLLLSWGFQWALPDKEKLDEVLSTMAFFYGFDPLEYFRLVKKGEEYRTQKPIDLSEYLGLELNEETLSLMPMELRKQRVSEYIRSKIRVIAKKLSSGIELPQCVIWSDGREFPIDKIDSAQERASFETGGVGTRFSCWLKGKQRYIGYEDPGDWFVETPCYA